MTTIERKKIGDEAIRLVKPYFKEYRLLKWQRKNNDLEYLLIALKREKTRAFVRWGWMSLASGIFFTSFVFAIVCLASTGFPISFSAFCIFSCALFVAALRTEESFFSKQGRAPHWSNYRYRAFKNQFSSYKTIALKKAIHTIKFGQKLISQDQIAASSPAPIKTE